MKLKNKLAILMILFMLVTNLLVTGFIIFSFSENFGIFLSYMEDQRIQKIASDIGEQVIIDGEFANYKIWNNRLKVYAEDSNINITIMDRNSQIVAAYRGLKNNPKRKIKTESYILLNDNKENVGNLIITHDLNNPAYERLKSEFKSDTITSIPIILPILLIAAFFLANRFSARLTKPIEDLSKSVQALSRGNYEDIEIKSSIPEIKTLSTNFSYLAASLKEQEEIRKAYGQDISHDLRTPLTNISLQLEAMEDGILPTDSSSLKVIKSNCDQLLSIVKRLRESYEDSSNSASSIMTLTNLSDLTNEVLNAFEPSVKNKQVELIRAIDPMIMLETDQRLYSEMLNNLLSNALKAVDEKGIIRVGLSKNKTKVLLSVTDNGVGIKKEYQKHIFDRFYRVDSSRNKALGGSGLGLAITKTIVNQLGGDIRLSSRPGRGTRFYINFNTNQNPT